MADDPATPATPWFTTGTAAAQNAPNSITADRGLTNQQLSKLATDVDSQNDDLVTALDAIATAINAKPSA